MSNEDVAIIGTGSRRRRRRRRRERRTRPIRFRVLREAQALFVDVLSSFVWQGIFRFPFFFVSFLHVHFAILCIWSSDLSFICNCKSTSPCCVMLLFGVVEFA